MSLQAKLEQQAEEIERLKALLKEKKETDLPQKEVSCTEGEIEELDKSDSKDPKWKQCQLCAHQYRNIRDLEKHYKSRHKEEKYELPDKKLEFGCDQCGKVYKEEQVLKRHKKTVHNADLCRFCGKPQTHIRRHEKICETKEKGKRKRKICDYCGNGFINLFSHLKTCPKRKNQLKGEQLSAPEPQSSTADNNYQRLESDNSYEGLQHEGFTEQEVQAEIFRLGNVAATFQQMASTAVQMASMMGMTLVEGVRSASTGQCLFEAVADQLLNRKPQEDEQPVFGTIVEELGEEQCTHQQLRLHVTNLLREREEAFDRFNFNPPDRALLSEEEALRQRREEWAKQLETLKKGGQYAMDAADLMVDAICAFLGLNMVILRTSSPVEHPFDVHTPQCLGGRAREGYPPLLLMFDEAKAHYEEARPQDVESEKRLMVLFELYTTQRRQDFLKTIEWNYKKNSIEADKEGDDEENPRDKEGDDEENLRDKEGDDEDNPRDAWLAKGGQQQTPGTSKRRKLYQTPGSQCY